MTHKATEIIKGEHRSLGSVIHALQYLAREARQGGQPDFKLIDAILDYIEEFPRRLHHPKEEDYLFRKLRARTSEANEIIEELERQHREEDEMLANLRARLADLKTKGTVALEPFARLTEDYANFHWQHMKMEENQVMPLAEVQLTEEDWAEINQAFESNDDPIFGKQPRDEFQQLFKFIANRLPAPIGYWADDTH